MPAVTPIWRIVVGDSVKNEPVYIWNTDEKYVPLQADWAWDTEGTFWSTGNSARRLRSTLTYRELQQEPYVYTWVWFDTKTDRLPEHRHGGWKWIPNPNAGIGWFDSRHEYDKQIYWVSRMRTEVLDQSQMDYPASKMTKGGDGTLNPNIVKHVAHLQITFKPAAPYFTPFTLDVYLEDYLNYYYMTFPYTDEGEDPTVNPIITPHSKARDTIDWKGKWLLWHSSRLEEGEPWVVPEYDDETGNFTRAAVTVLSGMPNQGHANPSFVKGNKDKGRGMSSTFNPAEPDYEARGPIPVPMFLGPGTVEIDAIYSEGIEIDLKPKPRSYISIKTNSDRVINNNGEPVSIPVQSILENFKDAYKWSPEKWNTYKGLISERPFNEEEEYYEGQIIPTIPAPYVVNEITINADWLAEAQVAGTKCAIVFVMAYGDVEITLNHFMRTYSEKAEPIANYTLQVIVDAAHVVAESPGEIAKGKPAFTFKAGYAYIIDPDEATGTPLQMEFDEYRFTATVPLVDEYYNFAAMIYRVVPDTDTTNPNGYKIDPECPHPIEYWYGITTPTDTDDIYRRLWSYTSPANPSESDDRERIICTKASMTKYDKISSRSGFLPVSDTTHVRVTVTVPSTADELDLPPEGSYIRFYLHNIDKGDDIWSDAMILLPTTAGGSVSREILFLVQKYTEGEEYQVYRQLYAATGEKIGAPRTVGARLTATKQYLINSLTMNIVFDDPDYPDYPVVKMSDLEMLYAPKDASYYYRFTIQTKNVTPKQIYTADLDTACHPSEFSWDVPLPTEDIQLADSTTYDLILSIYGESTRTSTLTEYYQLYTTKHYITSFSAVDVFAQEHPDDKQFLDNGNVKVQFQFHATTRLPASDTTYRCQIWLYQYTDEAAEPDTPPQKPIRVTHWDFPSITNVFDEVTEEPIELDLEHNTYRLSLQLIEKASPNTGREIYYTSWETPRLKASGWITGAGKKIRISTPSRFPSEEHAEYRMLRDGVLGTVESPWEMRTESVIGGNAVTQPAWIVRPRTVQFRIMVTAPAEQMSAALQSLFEVLTSAPTKGVELQLQTTDTMHQLLIFGYIQVGSPKIEIREDTVTIVSVALDCPNYAWKGHTQMLQFIGVRAFELPVPGHFPPSVDIWILKSGALETELTINGNDPLIIDTFNPSYSFIHVHHNPIVQDYYIELAKSLPPAVTDPSNTGRPGILRRHPPLSAHSILLGDEEENVVETQRTFALIKPGSYLPVILNPSQSNTIKVSEGRIVLVEYVPHYAFWW